MADPTGLAVTVVDNDAALSWAASGTAGVHDYSVFRRSPSTGAVFNPAGTPIASGLTGLTYADNDLPAGSYDWQVFGRVTFAPTITSASSASFTQGTPGSFTVTATGTPPPTLSMTGTLPAGVTFVAATGVLAGTPTASGTFPLVFTAANGTLPNAVQNFTLTVTAVVAWTPGSLPGLAGWWDADYPASIVAAAGRVSQWSDRSATANHFTQSNAAWQPATGRAVNGRNALDFIAANTWFMGAVPLVGPAQPTTVLLVVKPDVLTGTNVILDGGSGSRQQHAVSSSVWRLYADNIVSTSAATTATAQTVAVFNTSAGAFYLNGVQYNGAINPGTMGLATIAIGGAAGEFFDGAICEVVVMAGVITAGDRASWNAYCTAKWGTP